MKALNFCNFATLENLFNIILLSTGIFSFTSLFCYIVSSVGMLSSSNSSSQPMSSSVVSNNKRKQPPLPPKPDTGKVARQLSPPCRDTLSVAVEDKIKMILTTEIKSAIDWKLTEMLPEIIESIKSIINETLNKKLQEVSHFNVNQMDVFSSHHQSRVNNAPPPPPIDKAIMAAKSSLSKIIDQRIRRYYQQIRHTELAKLFRESLELDEPKLPRKFVEKIGRFDQPEIITKKKEMTISNVKNEIDILLIYADNDAEKLAQLDTDAAHIISQLSENNRKEAHDWYLKNKSENESKSKNIWAKKLKFLSSEKYLIPLSELLVTNYASENKTVQNNYERVKQVHYRPDSFNKNKMFDNSYINERRQADQKYNSYADAVSSTNSYNNSRRPRLPNSWYNGKKNFTNNYFHMKDQNFRRRNQY